MPDRHGRIRGISLHGTKNAWLHSLDSNAELERETEEWEEFERTVLDGKHKHKEAS